MKQAKSAPHYRLRIHRALEVLEVAAPGKQKLPVIRPMVYRIQLFALVRCWIVRASPGIAGKPAPTELPVEMGRVMALTTGVERLRPRLAGLLRKTGARKPALGGLTSMGL